MFLLITGLFSAASAAATSSSFFVKRVQPEVVTVKLGQPFEVVCTTYDWYEWCTFKHDENSCEIEWQYDLWNVTMGPCDHYRDRVEFRGVYNSFECGLQFSEARAEDGGDWSCDFESYIKDGSRGDGYTASKTFRVNVEIPTTTTTTTTTSTTTTIPTTTITTTTMTTTTVSSSTTVSPTTERADVVPAPEPEDEMGEIKENSDENHGEQDARIKEEKEEKKGEQEEQQEQQEDSTVLIIIAVCIIIVGGLSAVFFLNYRRVAGWKAVQSNMDAEKKIHCSIIKDGGGLDVSELGLLDDGGDVMADITTVTYMGEKEEEQKELQVKEDQVEKQEEKSV